MLDENGKTIIQIIDKKNANVESFYAKECFFIFHYANCKEDERYIYIYAALYDRIDFSDFNIYGKYRKIIIDKITKKVSIEKNEELEKLNLEFPICYEDKIVFSNNAGFVICKELDVIHRILFDDRYVCGEPVVKYIDGTPFLISLMFNKYLKTRAHLMVIDLNTYEIIEILLGESLNVGFHSIFVDRNSIDK